MSELSKFSKINQSIWASQRVGKLSDSHKLFYLFCLTCRHGNSAGCYYSPIGYMMVGMRWSEIQIRDAIAAVAATGLIAYDDAEDTLYLDRWYDYNPPTNPKHAAKVLSDILSIPYGPLKKRIFLDFSACIDAKGWELTGKALEAFDRLSAFFATKTETETKTKTERKVVVVKGAEEISPPGPADRHPHLDVGNRIAALTGWDKNPNWFGDFSRVKTWLDAGFDPELDIYPTIERLSKKFEGKNPPRTLSYFDQPVADAYARRMKPLPKGNADERVDSVSKSPRLTPAEQRRESLARARSRTSGED